MTVDVQPDPERYLLQDWIISFPDGHGDLCKDATAAKSSNWHIFRAVDQEWERTHYQRQSKIEAWCRASSTTLANRARRRRFDKAWVKILQTHLGAWKHAEFGLGTSLMQAQRYGYTQMINNATLTNSSYKLRFAQDITLYLAEIGMDLPGWDDALGKKAWLEDGSGRAPARRSRPSWARPTIWSSICHQRRLRAAGRRAVPLRIPDAGRPRPTTTSSPRR